MKKYRLIKTYPGSPKLDTEVKVERHECVHWNLKGFEIDQYKEFWKEVVEKDYEILSVIGNSGHPIPKTIVKQQKLGAHPSLNLHVENTKYWDILSIKRLSDGEIFTIGDNIEFNIHSYKKAIATITSFKLYGDKLCFLNDDLMYNASLDIVGNKIKQPLFKTEDGVDIFEGDTYYKVVNESFLLLTMEEASKGESLKSKIFSTKEKAEEYILMNKPCLSFYDVNEILTNTTINSIRRERLKELVKQKLNKNN